jgi:hypothetical protein
MMPGDFPLNLYRGDTGHWQFKLWLDSDKTVPVDLTDATAKAEIRQNTGQTPIYALGCQITGNVIDVTLDAATSATLPVTQLMWDLQLTYSSSGAINTIAAGKVTVTGDITDSTAMTTMAAATTLAPGGIARAPRKAG